MPQLSWAEAQTETATAASLRRRLAVEQGPHGGQNLTHLEGLRDERFLILSHPEALTYFQRKASDYDRWINGMRRIYRGDQS